MLLSLSLRLRSQGQDYRVAPKNIASALQDVSFKFKFGSYKILSCVSVDNPVLGCARAESTVYFPSTVVLFPFLFFTSFSVRPQRVVQSTADIENSLVSNKELVI